MAHSNSRSRSRLSQRVRKPGYAFPDADAKFQEITGVHRFFIRKRAAHTDVCSAEEDRNMWALFYEGGQVSREYPDEAAVWRALRQAGMLDEDLFEEGYEIKRLDPERESSFLG